MHLAWTLTHRSRNCFAQSLTGAVAVSTRVQYGLSWSVCSAVPAERSDVERRLARARCEAKHHWESATVEEGNKAGLAMGESELVSRSAMYETGVRSSSL